MWKTQANVVRFPLNKVSNWREKRERVALSFSVFNDESDAFWKAAVLHFKFPRSTRNAAEDIPTEQSAPCENTRISGSDEDPRGTARAEGQAR